MHNILCNNDNPLQREGKISDINNLFVKYFLQQNELLEKYVLEHGLSNSFTSICKNVLLAEVHQCPIHILWIAKVLRMCQRKLSLI